MPNLVEYEILVRDDGYGWLWVEVPALPGLFASGTSDQELIEALAEAVPLYLAGAGKQACVGEVSVAAKPHGRLAVTW